MSYWSQSDLEGMIGQQTVLNLYQDGGTGVVNPVYLAEVQSLSDGETDGGLARVWPGPYPVVQVFPTWAPSTSYPVGAMVVPTVQAGLAYRAVGSPGTTSGTQPTWPALLGSSVIDGGVTWIAVSTTPELIKRASLMFGRAYSYERHPDYVRRYGDGPRKAAEANLERLLEAKEYIEDALGSTTPTNVGGIVYAHGSRMTVDLRNGMPTTGDF